MTHNSTGRSDGAISIGCHIMTVPPATDRASRWNAAPGTRQYANDLLRERPCFLGGERPGGMGDIGTSPIDHHGGLPIVEFQTVAAWKLLDRNRETRVRHLRSPALLLFLSVSVSRKSSIQA